MDDELKLPSMHDMLLVLVGLVAHKEGILEDESTWYNFCIGYVSEIEETMKAASERGAALIAKENKQ